MIIPDKNTRTRITTELDKSFFVEAGAGSGKTRSLVERMTALIVFGVARIEYMSAVTFTRKAAAELRERFQNNLEHSLSDTTLTEAQKNNVHEALLNLDKTFLGTIHSFCAKLLRERPVEAGVDPGFEEVAEEDNTHYAREVWSEYLESERYSKDTHLKWIHDNDIKLSDLKNVFLRRIGYTDVEPITVDKEKPDLNQEIKVTKSFIEHIHSKIPINEPEKGWDPLQDIIVRARRLIKMGYCNQERTFIRILELLNKKIKVTLNRWDNDEAKDCLTKFEEFKEATVLTGLSKWGEYLHKPLIEFVDKGVYFYEQWRRERSLLNFQDLLLLTARLLEKNQEVRKYFKKQITHLLVDEFQDTDPIQAQIILLLTGSNDEESCWYKLVPRAGSLFVVGDPKQSIFRFRRADIDIYNQVKDIFSKSGSDILNLTTNFRSLPEIGEFVNNTFDSLFTKEKDTYQACFSPLVTIRHSETDTFKGVIEQPIPKIGWDRAAKAAEIDAKVIAGFIKHALSGGIKLERTEEEKKNGITSQPVPGDFMIITRKKANLVHYARALEKMDIPYDLTGGQNFKDSRELREIQVFLKAVCEPKNPVYLVAALRGLLFGISDDQLYKFKIAGGRFSYYSKIPTGFEPIEKAFNLFKECKTIIDTNVPVTAFEKIIDKLGLISLAISRETGATRCGNILKCFELLAFKQPEDIGGFSDIVEHLKELLDSGSVEEMNLFPETSKVVRLMNLHKAKGLEASVVFLADPLGATKEYDPDYHVSRTEKGSKGYFLVMKENKSNNTPLAFPIDWDNQLKKEIKYLDAEKRRLEYVAATRAKNALVISTYRANTNKAAWKEFYAYLEKCEKLKIEETIEPVTREKAVLTQEEFTKQQKTLKEKIETLNKPTYKITTVTALAKDNAVFSLEGATAGLAWGSLIHKALEACAKGKYANIGLLIRNWLNNEASLQFQAEDIMVLIDAIMKSELWQRYQKSPERFAEAPFSVKTETGVLNGAIDLVFKEEGAWVIVDYKTDNFQKDPARKAAYQKQLDLYAKYWQDLTGEPVKETILFEVKKS